jgi:hypothetical protein
LEKEMLKLLDIVNLLKLRHDIPKPAPLVTKLQKTDLWAANIADMCAGLGRITSASASENHF